MRFSRRRHLVGDHSAYIGKHQARRRGGAAGTLAALLRGGVAGLVALLILAMLAIATLIVLSSSPPTAPGTAAPPPAPGTAAPPTAAATTTPPPTRPKVTLIAAVSFRDGVQPWRAVAGSIFTRGELYKPGVSYARIQQDPTTPPATDRATGKSVVGIRADVPNADREGIQVQAVIRVRATKPGTMMVIRLSEWQGTRRVGGRDGRVTLLDTSWREITSDYRVLRSGSKVELEILALALGADQALFIEPPVVTGT
jgi:hypothetical protein